MRSNYNNATNTNTNTNTHTHKINKVFFKIIELTYFY